MLSVSGIYDGKSVKITDEVNDKRKYKVVVTFIEEIHDQDVDLRSFSSDSKGLSFWSKSEEDIYQDYLLK